MRIGHLVVLVLSANVLFGTTSSAWADYLKAIKCVAWSVPRGSEVDSSVSVKIKNIHTEEISVVATEKQIRNFGMGHEMGMYCSVSYAKGVPVLRGGVGNEDFEDYARANAVNLSPGSTMNIVFYKSSCHASHKIKNKFMALKNGYFAGNVYVSIGSRFIVQSISCDF